MVQANHRLYTTYHERILNGVDTCLPVEKIMSIDEMARRLIWTPSAWCRSRVSWR
jgi:DNA polymerase-4